MWQLWGTVAVSALGGSFLLHYLRNSLLAEKVPLTWDWDGIVERGVITYLLATGGRLYLIPAIIAAKVIGRLLWLGFGPGLAKRGEPGAVSQKVLLKAELGFDLIVSPAFAILIGVVF
jgi:hypothetical protein